MPAKEVSFIQNHFVLILLIQGVLYSLIWVLDEYVAVYVCTIFPAMLLIILLLSLIADWIEPARITPWYYRIMIASILVPVIISAAFYLIYRGRIDWIGL